MCPRPRIGERRSSVITFDHPNRADPSSSATPSEDTTPPEDLVDVVEARDAHACIEEASVANDEFVELATQGGDQNLTRAASPELTEYLAVSWADCLGTDGVSQLVTAELLISGYGLPLTAEEDAAIAERAYDCIDVTDQVLAPFGGSDGLSDTTLDCVDMVAKHHGYLQGGLAADNLPEFEDRPAACFTEADAAVFNERS